VANCAEAIIATDQQAVHLLARATDVSVRDDWMISVTPVVGVGDSKSASLSRGQVIAAEGRHTGDAELVAGRQPAIARRSPRARRRPKLQVEAKLADVVREVPDLLLLWTRGLPGQVSALRLADQRSRCGASRGNGGNSFWPSRVTIK
jgi:hypothetical protein